LTDTQEVHVMSGDTRRHLADYFEDQARWRDLKADEYPDDARNVRSAAALRELAEFVLTLSPEDYRIKRVEILIGDADGILSPGEEAAHVAGQMDFHRQVPPEVSLNRFIEAALGDRGSVDPSAYGLSELVDRIDDSDPDSLFAVGLLRRWAEDAEEMLVLKARVEGWSWKRIADELGRSKQAVWERYRDPEERTPDDN